MAPTSSLLRLADGRTELKLNGFFSHPHFMVFLLSGLTTMKASVVEGRALQNGEGVWNIRLLLDCSACAGAQNSADFVAMAQTKPTVTQRTRPRLTSFTLRRRLDRALEVWIEGADQIGFLAGLLNNISLLALFPLEMEVATLNGHIKDKLVLRGIGGAVPADTIDEPLRGLLQSMVAKA